MCSGGKVMNVPDMGNAIKVVTVNFDIPHFKQEIVDTLKITWLFIEVPDIRDKCNKKDGYRQQNVRQRQKLISIID